MRSEKRFTKFARKSKDNFTLILNISICYRIYCSENHLHLKQEISRYSKSLPAKFSLLLYACCFFQVMVTMGKQPFPGAEKYKLAIRKASVLVKTDGILDDPAWAEADTVFSFYQHFPFDSSFSRVKTKVMVTYDDRHIHIAAICYDDMQSLNVQSLRRDFALKTNDNFAVYFDPFLDGANGFNFAVTPFGNQREALIQVGDRSYINWDNKWFSNVERHANKWIVEMAIPLTTIRYSQGLDHWKINFSRTDVSENEVSTWVPIPRNFELTTLSYTADMIWDQTLKKAGANVSLIPYAATRGDKTYTPTEGKTNTSAAFGGDAKIAVTSGLNLDLTVNPDFSQVEVDRQVTNLSRFELFFPEQRQFFTENSDLFSSSGFSRIRPFFSRRIGLINNPFGQGVLPTTILFGARLSGKLNPDWRIGLLNVQTDNNPGSGTFGENFTVATVQRKIFNRSNIAGLFVNKTSLDPNNPDLGFKPTDNRVIGIDYNLSSKDNRWNGKIFYHQTFSTLPNKDNYAHASWIRYNVPNWVIDWNHEFVGKNYRPEVGYILRDNHWRLEPSVEYRHYPNSSKINYHGFQAYADAYWSATDLRKTDQSLDLTYKLWMKNTTYFAISAQNEYIYLFRDFDPTNTGGERLKAGTDYSYSAISCSLSTDRRKTISYGFTGRSGTYFNGNRHAAGGDISYRWLPWGIISLAATYDRLLFPEPYKSANFLLLGPKAELSFSRSVFFTTFIQYNQQANNVNIFSRLQWRFAPVSDLFVVYTENYLPDPVRPRNRSLVIKLTYWFNV